MEKELKKTIQYLKQGKVILYPTDTVWGIGCDATNSRAIQKIYNIKKREETKSMIILVDSIEMLRDYVQDVPDVAVELNQSISDPLTVIYPKAKGLASNLIADDGTIAIRVVKHDFCKDIIKGLGKPIVSTSANISGMPTPISFDYIEDEIKDQMDYTVSLFRQNVERIKPSTIIRIEHDGSYTVIRK
ncbi:MAG: L-threonylcarbamoyladenylate synthase [Hyphomicrobiales bacterium]